MDPHKEPLTAEQEEEELTTAIMVSLDGEDTPHAQAVDEFSDEFLMQEPKEPK
ncbi:MAG: hypothetical protein ABIT83_26440 [Massilia sp.]